MVLLAPVSLRLMKAQEPWRASSAGRDVFAADKLLTALRKRHAKKTEEVFKCGGNKNRVPLGGSTPKNTMVTRAWISNVRFAPLCELKSDISRSPRSVTSGLARRTRAIFARSSAKLARSIRGARL